MKDLKIQVPENTYTLSRAEISLIYGLCVSAPDGMTQWANMARIKLMEQLRFHEAIRIYKVWKE